MSSQVLRNQSAADVQFVNGSNVGAGGIVTTGAISAVGNISSRGSVQGSSEILAANSFTAPSTGPASANLSVLSTNGGGLGGTPYLNLSMVSANPNLIPVGNGLQVYATTAATAPGTGTSVVVARPGVNSLPINAPAGASGTFTGTGGNANVAVATMTAASQVQVWLIGGSAGAFTAGITAPAITVTATGFTHNAVNGAIYGYNVLYA